MSNELFMTVGGYLTNVISIVFFLVLISYYVLLIIPKKKRKIHKKFSSISILVPAHNEEEFIEACLNSLLKAKFNGKKEIIVINDGSIDKTSDIVKKYVKNNKEIHLIETKHSGKSASLNLALKKATGELIAIVDADSEIHSNALVEMSKELGQKNVAGACCVVRVKNRKKFLCIWPHLEQIYNSLMRSILAKVNANVTTPGPLSVYRKKALDKISGFSTEGFSEDVDVAIRLIRMGYKLSFCEGAIAETNLPYDLKGFLRQRARFARGMLNIFKRHLKVNNKLIDIYTMPLLLFTYVQAVIMGSLTIYNITDGYLTYFAAKGIPFFSTEVLWYFLNWTTIMGTIQWVYGIMIGNSALTLIAMVGIVSAMLSFPLFLYSIIKYDKRFDLYNIIPFIFMTPFWWFIMIVYIVCLPEVFMKKQKNIWKKNE